MPSSTPQSAANATVRAFLLILGERELGHKFTKNSTEWKEIVSFFDSSCAYCERLRDCKLYKMNY